MRDLLLLLMPWLLLLLAGVAVCFRSRASELENGASADALDAETGDFQLVREND